ncbi:MAG: efflux RND transporter permease subunit [Thermoanaerobaculia bacterium]|nr:efflux RND transporter permease subunit [Thermoanaerobaculia bacterium]
MSTGFAGRIAHAFLDSKLTPLVIAASLALGALAMLATPREEEPQIRVPMIDVQVGLPGADPAEVATRVLDPLEQALLGTPGLEHVYGTARPGGALVTARFHVGEDYEASLVKVFERVAAARGQLPAEATPAAIELHTIDDVPFLTLTLASTTLGGDELRPLAVELARELSEVDGTRKVRTTGGAPRVVRVEPDPDRLAATGITWAELQGALVTSAGRFDAGSMVTGNRETRVEAGPLLADAAAVERTVVGVRDGRPIYAADVARVLDGPDEARDAVFHVVGAASATAALPAGTFQPAVTISLAKRPGTNASVLADQVLAKLEALRPRLVPAEVTVTVTRDYGESARHKSNELLDHLLIATLSVVALISLTMGWRSGLVVGIAVPVTLALTLFIYYLAGYTLNRVTLFALIFSIGILVDDAIVVVENIERHFRDRRGRSLTRAAVEAVDEVGNPTVLATFTVIAAILPMAFVGGLMGPYMAPIPTGASAAMLFSLGVAFLVSPWAAVRIFKRHAESHAEETAKPEGWTTRGYRRLMTRLLRRPAARWSFFALVSVLFLGAVGLVWGGLVKVKMLPFDNKSELQLLVDHDEGTPFEVTLETAQDLARAITTDPVVGPLVEHVQVYAGVAAPVNFNGLVRHYFLRRAPESADLQINFVPKGERAADSHALARQFRDRFAALGRDRGAQVKIIEIPPGPPVLDTVVAELYGPTATERETFAVDVREIFETTPGVVDVDDTLVAERDRVVFELDRERVGLAGVPPAAVLETLAASGAGREVARLDLPQAREPVPVRLALSAADRSRPERRLALRVATAGGAVALSELVAVGRRPEPQPVHHKDGKPVVYVFADLAGERESPVYALADLNTRLDSLRTADGEPIERLGVAPPETSDRLALKWDGEWQITYEVFRDLGIAFAVVLGLIAILVIGWFQSFRVPLAILLPIPLSLIGILPGHLLFGAFFTATSMIGFIAGAGIIVRNSIILVDFIELELRQGKSLEDAVVEAGVVRFRPMLLTAAAVVVGSLVILFDPIFQGLALSLMMGEVAATLLSRLAVPVVYFLVARGRRERELRAEALTTS